MKPPKSITIVFKTAQDEEKFKDLRRKIKTASEVALSDIDATETPEQYVTRVLEDLLKPILQELFANLACQFYRPKSPFSRFRQPKPMTRELAIKCIRCMFFDIELEARLLLFRISLH